MIICLVCRECKVQMKLTSFFNVHFTLKNFDEIYYLFGMQRMKSEEEIDTPSKIKNTLYCILV